MENKFLVKFLRSVHSGVFITPSYVEFRDKTIWPRKRLYYQKLSTAFRSNQMREFVGVKHLIGVPDTAWIKQEALMFDKVAVADYHIVAPMLRKGSCPRQYNY